MNGEIGESGKVLVFVKIVRMFQLRNFRIESSWSANELQHTSDYDLVTTNKQLVGARN